MKREVGGAGGIMHWGRGYGVVEVSMQELSTRGKNMRHSESLTNNLTKCEINWFQQMAT